MPSLSLRRPAGPILLAGLVLAASIATAPEVRSQEDHGLVLVPHVAPGGGDRGVEEAELELVIDDGSAEGVFGFAGGTARQFLWFNRFDSPGPFDLDEIQVLFPAGTDVMPGDDVQILVWVDPDGDAANGADLLYEATVAVGAADGTTFTSFPLATPLEILGDDDILIGVVNRYHETGVDPPPTFPAAVDTTAPAGRSFFAIWAGDPPATPDLSTATTVAALAGPSAGNFTIRGIGSRVAPIVVPTLDVLGLVLLALALAGGGLVAASRRAVKKV